MHIGSITSVVNVNELTLVLQVRSRTHTHTHTQSGRLLDDVVTMNSCLGIAREMKKGELFIPIYLQL